MEASQNQNIRPIKDPDKKIFDDIDKTLLEYDEYERRRVDYELAMGKVALMKPVPDIAGRDLLRHVGRAKDTDPL